MAEQEKYSQMPHVAGSYLCLCCTLTQPGCRQMLSGSLGFSTHVWGCGREMY